MTNRAERREALHAAQRRLEALLAIPPLTAEDMCSECATPARKYGWSTPPTDGPCAAWPRWAARIQHAREMLLRFSRDSRPLEPPQPKHHGRLQATESVTTRRSTCTCRYLLR